MPRLRHVAAVASSLAMLALASLVGVACHGDPVGAAANAVDAAPEAAQRGRASSSDPTEPAGADDDGGTGGDRTVCEATRAWAEACGHGKDLTCGSDRYETWCTANDGAINSETFRRAELACLTRDNCAPARRHDCEYRVYVASKPTPAQTALVSAYCATCEPHAASACIQRASTYDVAAGPNGVDDVFVAAWELSDALTDEIRTTCTGSALGAGAATDAGPDAGADGGADAGKRCLEAFAQCAGDVYVAHVPSCP